MKIFVVQLPRPSLDRVRSWASFFQTPSPYVLLSTWKTMFRAHIQHTSWSRVLLEKLTGSHPVKNFSAFCGTQKFITAFTSARHLSLSWARSIQSMPPHPTSWRSILILSSHIHNTRQNYNLAYFIQYVMQKFPDRTVASITRIECAQISSLTQFLFVGSSVFELSTPIKNLLPIFMLLFWPAFFRRDMNIYLAFSVSVSWPICLQSINKGCVFSPL